MAYEDFKEGCSVIKGYVDNLNKETVGKIPTKVSELTNDSNYATESYVNTAIGNIAQPSSLPQTYKKKAVTLATSGWAEAANIKIAHAGNVNVSGYTTIKIGHTDLVDGFTTSITLSIDSLLYNALIPTKSAKVKKATTSGGLASYWYSDFKNSGNTTVLTIKIYAMDKNGYKKGDILAEYNPPGAPQGIAGTDNINVFCSGIGTKQYINTYTDADVKVNSEVRFTLDEANGKIAGQSGLKKTIDKEAGKLTFTADTLPTSAISGTLEIGETSTEGAAFVDGISSEGVKANEENTFTAKQTFQDVQINGNLTAKGTTTTVDVKNLDVEQQLITVAKGNTAALTSPAGLKAEKYDGTKDGALVFDASGMAMVGDVVLDANGNIDEAQSDLQDLATRAKPSELTDGHLLKWDATNKKIVDGGANAIEQTAEVIKFPTFLINGTKVQRVCITGRETIQPGGSKQATVNLATYGIDATKMLIDGNMHEYILASVETLSTDTTYFPKVRADASDVSGNRTLFFNIDTEPPAEEACIINYQYICLIKVEV